MPYSPPPGGSLTLSFSSSPYSPPPGSSITLEFEPPEALQITGATVGDAALYGSPNMAQTRFIDLHASSDGIASAEAIGLHDVDFRRVKPGSIHFGEEFGTAFVFLQQQFVVAESIAAPLDQVTDLRVRDGGLTYLDNLPDGGALELEFFAGYTPPPGGYLVLEFNPGGTPTIRTTGIPSLVQFGVASIGSVPRLAPDGIYEGDVGEPTIFNLNRTLVVPGISSDEGFGHLQVIDQRQYVSTTGMYEGGAGAPYLENLNRTVYPSRIDPEGVGDPTLIGPRYLPDVSAGLDGAVGDHTVIGPLYVLAEQFDASAVSVPTVVGGAATVVAQGIDTEQDQVSLGAVVNDDSQRIYPDGLGEDDEWDHIIGNDPLSVVEGAGAIDESGFGVHEAWLAGIGVQTARPAGISMGAVGAPRMLPVRLRPSGIGSSAYGRPFVSNYIRYLRPTGISSARYGTTWASNYIRYVTPAGFDESIVWNDFGPVTAEGGAARVYNVAADVVLASGWDSSVFGVASVATALCRD